jgi:hypothetical protein
MRGRGEERRGERSLTWIAVCITRGLSTGSCVKNITAGVEKRGERETERDRERQREEN